MASVNIKKLNAPSNANNLDEAVRMTLAVMQEEGSLAQFTASGTLSIQVWHRLVRAGFTGVNTTNVAAVINQLLKEKTLVVSQPVKGRRASILAGR